MQHKQIQTLLPLRTTQKLGKIWVCYWLPLTPYLIPSWCLNGFQMLSKILNDIHIFPSHPQKNSNSFGGKIFLLSNETYLAQKEMLLNANQFYMWITTAHWGICHCSWQKYSKISRSPVDMQASMTQSLRVKNRANKTPSSSAISFATRISVLKCWQNALRLFRAHHHDSTALPGA